MSGSVRQKTRVGRNSFTRVTNTYPMKRGRLENLPPNSKIHFEKGFERTDLKQRIARLKSSPSYKSGVSEAKRKMKTVSLKRNQTLRLRNKNLRVFVNAS